MISEPEGSEEYRLKIPKLCKGENIMDEKDERAELLDEMFNDDPSKKEREKEIEKLTKKREKQLKKLEKKGGLSEQDDEEISSEITADDENNEENEEDAVSEKKRKKKKKKEKEKDEINIVRDLINLGIYILIIIVICWFVLTYIGQRTVVSGDSMNDTLSNGDSLWVDKISYRFSDPERYDIVIFPYGDEEDETYYIKRIIGLPGETVYIDEDGVIYIDDEPLEENYGKEVIEEGHRGLASEPITLGEDEYFVMGDNRNNSRDSRLADVGNISKDDLIGKAVFRFTGGFGFIE